ncbi:MAG: hypothetical protein FWC13_01835 [Oscillospiraceae bacterium]|nr:hypothetical protein [Oscillospiraceae bacterium]
MRPPIKSDRTLLAFWILLLVFVAIGALCKVFVHFIQINAFDFLFSTVQVAQHVTFYSFMLAIILIIVAFITWGFRHRLYTRGFKHAIIHARLLHRVRKSLHEAKYYITDGFSSKEISARLPNVRIVLDKDNLRGQLELECHILWEKPYESICLSSALSGGYVIEESYITDDGNHFIYEFSHMKTQRQEVFTNAEDFVEWAKCGDYELKIDSRSPPVELSSSLFVGATGSGKSLSLINFIHQCLAKSIKYYLYYADVKMTDLGALGKRISKDSTAETIEEIIELMRKFHNAIETRKVEYQKMLEGHYSVDYRDFGLSPHIFIMEEASSVFAFIGKMEKSIRDEFSTMLKAVILQGRALGCFIFFAMQKSDATSIPTEIRDNLPCKILLARGVENTTVITLFGVSATIPNRRYSAGQGCYSTPATGGIKLCFFPTLNFDVPTEIAKIAKENDSTKT